VVGRGRAAANTAATASPKPGELLVRMRACSLNFRDAFVVQGKLPCADGRIPLSDGAGEVIAVGDDVDEFKVGDTVVSTFYQIRLSGISIGSRADQEDMIRAITANRLKPVIDRSFPLQEIVAAFKYYESQKHFGKACLEL
jgi:NADPH:quinone reductase-like Zn-dependent oxidoreductase